MDTDEQLYREARRGSEIAFRTLYARYEKPLFAYLVRRLSCREEAEEIFHETLFSLLRGPELPLESGSLAPWLFKVALNRSLNQARSHTREKRAMIRLAYEQSDHTDSAEELISERPSVEDMRLQAGKLNAPLKTVYEMRSQGKSYEEMSAELGIPLGTVKSRVHKMLSELKKGMEKWTAK